MSTQVSSEFKRAVEAEVRRLTEASVSTIVDTALGHLNSAVESLLTAEGQLTRDGSKEGKRAQAFVGNAASKTSEAVRIVKQTQPLLRGLRDL